MSFSNFELADAVIQGVYASGYSTPTEIQFKAIPLVMQGKDIIGIAPTGTGKTAAFVLPILNRLGKQYVDKRDRRLPRTLILTPTRELAQQIEDAIRTYGTYTDITTICLYGGVGIGTQLRGLKNGCDIVIATPGRLLDHMERRSINLSRVEVLVLDEADRMYDMGFIHDVRKIISHVPPNRQTLLFSATMSSEIRALVAGIQRQPCYIEIGQANTPVDTVTQQFYSAEAQSKLDLLVHILKNEEIETMLVFSRTKHGADKIAYRLARSGVSTAAIHADRSQSQRQDALDGFKRREFKVLVATNIAARGIDVDGISHVVNFDTPMFAEDYIHRIGRTGRAEAKGTAFTFVADDEKKYLKRIEYLTGKRYEVKQYPGFNYPARLLANADAKPAGMERKRQYYRTPRFR